MRVILVVVVVVVVVVFGAGVAWPSTTPPLVVVTGLGAGVVEGLSEGLGSVSLSISQLLATLLGEGEGEFSKSMMPRLRRELKASSPIIRKAISPAINDFISAYNIIFVEDVKC